MLASVHLLKPLLQAKKPDRVVEEDVSLLLGGQKCRGFDALDGHANRFGPDHLIRAKHQPLSIPSVDQGVQLLAHIQHTRAQYQVPEFARRLAYPANRDGVAERFLDASVRKSVEVDLALLERYDSLITDLEYTLVRTAKQHDADAFHRLRSVPGIGKILALTILYELHDVHRFDRVQEFASYARLVKGRKQSGGKTLGTSGAKMGNVHLKWAFSEAAVLFLRHASGGKRFLVRIEKKHGKGKALSILAHKLGRAVYYMLARDTVFSLEKFMAA